MSKATPKKAVNVSVNTELLARARSLGVNLSQALEERLSELVRVRECDRWLAENKKALEDYSARIARDGVFSDGRRRF